MSVEWPLLTNLTADERNAFLGIARRRVFERGDIVFHRHDPADALHLIRRGRFAVRIVTPLGYTATLATLVGGETFGELALLGERRRTASVVALERGETLCVHQPAFAALCRRHPTVTDALARALGARIDQLSAQLVEALYVPAERRVLRRVADLATAYRAGDGVVEVPLTQEEVGGLAGAARGTVNRVLKDAEARGEVRVRRGGVLVLDQDAIRRRGGL